MGSTVVSSSYKKGVCMQILMNLFLVVAFSLTMNFASAAALCPADSCNPHNGCMDGCFVKDITGIAACNSENPAEAEQQALKNGVDQAYKSCYHNYFLRSKWQTSQVSVGDKCEVRAQATISCYQ